MSKSKPYNKSSNGRRRQDSNRNGRQALTKLQGTQQSIDAPITRKETRSNSTKNQRREKETADTSAAMSRANPVQLYTGAFPEFVKDAATLPFALPLGTPVNMGNNDVIIPGVMRLRFSPAIGVSKDFTSPINRASIRFYTYMRSNQKASATYDHQDITMMEVSMDSAYMFHALMRRVYGVVNEFTPANEYYSRAIVQACGFDFDDLRANLQDFRAFINAYGYSLGQYALPKNLSWFERHQWMCEGIYTDSSSTKAQTYIWVPDIFYKYDNTVETGSQCVAVAWLSTTAPSQVHTVAEARAFGTALLNAVSNEEDFAIISGDIYNFYGGDTFTLPYVDENYTILPTFDKTVLSQIENAHVVGPLSATTISQNPAVNGGAIIYQPVAPLNDAKVPLINMHMDSPTPEDVIEATRMTAVLGQSSTTPAGRFVLSCGTEICTGFDIYDRDVATRNIVTNYYAYGDVTLSSSSTESQIMSNLDLICHMAQFDWAPALTVNVQKDDGTFVVIGTTWDVDNFNYVPEVYLDNIHTGCLLNEFTPSTNRK